MFIYYQKTYTETILPEFLHLFRFSQIHLLINILLKPDWSLSWVDKKDLLMCIGLCIAKLVEPCSLPYVPKIDLPTPTISHNNQVKHKTWCTTQTLVEHVHSDVQDICYVIYHQVFHQKWVESYSRLRKKNLAFCCTMKIT